MHFTLLTWFFFNFLEIQCFVLTTLAASSRPFEVGTTYSFEYFTSVLSNDLSGSAGKDVGFRFSMAIDVTPIWQSPSDVSEQLLQFKVRSPKLSMRAKHGSSKHEFMDKKSKLELGHEEHFIAHQMDGMISAVYHTNHENSWLNIKKAIASIFQFQQKNVVREETLSFGTCQVEYAIKGENSLAKRVANCSTPESFPFFRRNEPVLDALITRETEMTYELDSGSGGLMNCAVWDRLMMRDRFYKCAGIEVVTKQSLVFKEKEKSRSNKYEGKSAADVVGNIAKSIGLTLKHDHILTKPEPQHCITCESLKNMVNNLRKSLGPANIGTRNSAVAYLHVLKKLRRSERQEVKSVFSDKRNAPIMDQLVDLAAASQTWSSYEIAKSSFDFMGRDVARTERFLVALSLATHPSVSVIEDLMKYAHRQTLNTKLKESLLLCLSSMARAFGKNNGFEHKIFDRVLKFLFENLDKCNERDCVAVYVRAFNNLKHKLALPMLLKIAQGSDKKSAVTAMRAIQMMPRDYIDNQTRTILTSILFERLSRHDSSVRSMAAEILLRWPVDPEVLKGILLLFKGQAKSSKELHTLLWNYILDLCEKNYEMDQLSRRSLLETSANNWNWLSHGGLSSAFSRSFATRSNCSGGAYFTNMLEVNGGILKRSNVGVFINVDDDVEMNFLSFGVFAGGLSMFAGDDSSDDSSDADVEEPTAGIEIALLGHQLRPIVFFTGQAELMGHVWSGTASEKTTALQGLMLLQDHLETVPLVNGLGVELSLTGMISYDFSGQVQISLWNRNAHSLVEVGSSVVLRGSARVDSSFVQSVVEINSGAEIRLDFLSDLDFAQNILMCLQMIQQDLELTDTVRKLEKVLGHSYVLHKYRKNTKTIPGKTYVMNKKNTEICTMMFKNV